MKKLIAMIYFIPFFSFASPVNECLDVGERLNDSSVKVALSEVGKYVKNNKEAMSNAIYYGGNYYIFNGGKVIFANKNASKIIFTTHSSGELEYPMISIMSCKVSTRRELMLFSMDFDMAGSGSAAAQETSQAFIYDPSLGVSFGFSNALSSSSVNSIAERNGAVYYINDSYVLSPRPQESFSDSKRYLVNRTIFKLENRLAKPVFRSRGAYVQSRGEPSKFFNQKYFNEKFDFDKIVH